MNEAQYIREAADKFKDSGAMFPAQIEQQYRDIQERPSAPVQPYVYENSSVDPIPWQRVAIGTAKITAAATGVAIAGKLVIVGVAAIFAFIEANALVCGGILVAVVLALTASGGNSGSGGGNSGHPGSSSGGNTIIVNNTTIINGGTVQK